MDYRYKIGQKVKVRKDLNRHTLYGGIVAMSTQVALVGKEVIIRDCRDGDYFVEGNEWRWTNEMFEEVRRPCYCKSLL